MSTLWSVALLVAVLNLPFGYWRASAIRFSRPWLLAIHIPVPLVIALRISSGLGWQLSTFPVIIATFFVGQYLGGRLHYALKRRFQSPVTACLVWDIVTNLGPGKGGLR